MTEEAEKKMSDEAAARVIRRRSIAIAIMLGLMVALFYAATLVRLGGNVANRAI